MSNTFVPPRGADGKIVLGDAPPAAPATPAVNTAPRSLADLLPSVQRTAPPAAPDPGQGRMMAASLVAMLLVAGALAVWGWGWEATAPVAVPTTGAGVALVPTPAAPSSTPAPTGLPVLPVGLATYFAPGGALAPSLPVTSVYTPTARYQGDWVLLEIAGYRQPVWIRADTVPGIDLAELDDLTPPPTATPAPVVIVRQAPAPAPVVLDCTRERAVFVATRSSAFGSVEAWSCESQGQADARADARIAEINAGKATP